MSFRRLDPGDAAGYRRLRLFGLRESPAAFGSSHAEEAKRPMQFFAERLRQTQDKWTIGAFSGKRLVGIVTLVRDSSLKGRHKASVFGMYVSPNSRRQGIGRELLARAVEVANGFRGLKQIHLDVVSSNRPALRLYEATGFVAYGEEPRALFVNGRYYAATLLCLILSPNHLIKYG